MIIVSLTDLKKTRISNFVFIYKWLFITAMQVKKKKCALSNFTLSLFFYALLLSANFHITVSQTDDAIFLSAVQIIETAKYKIKLYVLN